MQRADAPFVKSTMHVPARSPTNIDVMIRLVVKGDEGKEHLKVLRYLANDKSPRNHSLPLLELIEHEDMVFAVFPLVCESTMCPYYETVSEVFNMLEQLFEVSIFCSPFGVSMSS